MGTLHLVNEKVDCDRDSESMSFHHIIIDTAPTEHTVPLLSFPDFLESLLLQAVQLCQRLSRQFGMIGTVVNSMLSMKRDAALEAADEEVSAYRDKMVELSDLFRKLAHSGFVVVTTSTQLTIAGTRRLVAKLTDVGIFALLSPTNNYPWTWQTAQSLHTSTAYRPYKGQNFRM